MQLSPWQVIGFLALFGVLVESKLVAWPIEQWETAKLALKSTVAFVGGSLVSLVLQWLEARGGGKPMLGRSLNEKLVLTRQPCATSTSTSISQAQPTLLASARIREPTLQVGSKPGKYAQRSSTCTCLSQPSSCSSGRCYVNSIELHSQPIFDNRSSASSACIGIKEKQHLRKVQLILNKLTWTTLDKLYQELLETCILEDSVAQGEAIAILAQEIFTAAVSHRDQLELYVALCANISKGMLCNSASEPSLPLMLLKQCQERIKVPLPCKDGELLVNSKAELLASVKLLGLLLRSQVIHSRRAPKIILDLTDELVCNASPKSLEMLCAFLHVVGPTFDNIEWSGYARLNQVFVDLREFLKQRRYCLRIRFLVEDLLIRRERGWTEKTESHPAPTKIVSNLWMSCIGAT
eukprot:TRINITY_DN3344_c0_g1_i2.p1 TRINITY_DN3344_c0_g1~~TRINITY_DN3344_c0_g1_i2.p1  ORF type:complete len:408 (-),score=54.09 TRINITY_DN3344_c0_g1_i2:72-1295(-)